LNQLKNVRSFYEKGKDFSQLSLSATETYRNEKLFADEILHASVNSSSYVTWKYEMTKE